MSAHPEQSELVVDALWTLGVGGIEERALPDGRVELIVALGEGSAESAAASTLVAELRRITSDFGAELALDTVEIAPQDSWRDHATEMVIDDRLVIVPAWQHVRTAASPDVVPLPDVVAGVKRLTVPIEPAGSFGLGDHPTTQMCARIVAETFRSRPGGSLLDVGCGSGVLAIIGALLGARPVRAIDVAPAAVDATLSNAQLNGVTDYIEVDDEPITRVDGVYDVVMANVLAPALVSMAPDLQRLTGDQLTISGILHGRFDHVVDALSPMEVEAVVELDGWAAVTLRHRR